jgi:hypothetical protein
MAGVLKDGGSLKVLWRVQRSTILAFTRFHPDNSNKSFPFEKIFGVVALIGAVMPKIFFQRSLPVRVGASPGGQSRDNSKKRVARRGHC